MTEGPLLALAMLSETLIAAGVIDREMMVDRAMNAARSKPPGDPLREDMEAYALMLSGRAGARLRPSWRG